MADVSLRPGKDADADPADESGKPVKEGAAVAAPENDPTTEPAAEPGAEAKDTPKDSSAELADAAKPEVTSDAPSADGADAAAQPETAGEAETGEADKTAESKTAESEPTDGKPADAKPVAEKPADPAAEKPAAGAAEKPAEKPAAGAADSAGDAVETIELKPSGAVGAGSAPTVELKTMEKMKPVAQRSGNGTTAGKESDGEAADNAAAAGEPGGVPKQRTPASKRTLLVAALSVVLVLLVAAGVFLFVSNQSANRLAASKEQALTVAKQTATDLTSISADTAKARTESLAQNATGQFKSQISQYGSLLETVLKQSNAGSNGTVSAAAVEKIDDANASVLVTVAATVTNNKLPQAQPVSYRLAVQLTREGDRWLTSDLNFVS